MSNHRAAAEAWGRERNIYAGKYAAERDENERLRSRLQLARSTVEVVRRYFNALEAGDIDAELLAFMRTETRHSLAAFVACEQATPIADTIATPEAGET